MENVADPLSPEKFFRTKNTRAVTTRRDNSFFQGLEKQVNFFSNGWKNRVYIFPTLGTGDTGFSKGGNFLERNYE